MAKSAKKATTTSAKRELAQIRASAAGPQKNLFSTDRAVAKKAQADLDAIAKSLRAWAKKHGVTLRSRTETPAATARRRCQATFDTDYNGETYTCDLMGRKRRNCMYICGPHRLHVTF